MNRWISWHQWLMEDISRQAAQWYRKRELEMHATVDLRMRLFPGLLPRKICASGKHTPLDVEWPGGGDTCLYCGRMIRQLDGVWVVDRKRELELRAFMEGRYAGVTTGTDTAADDEASGY